MKKKSLLMFLVLFCSLTPVFALDLSISEPQNKTYTYSTNLELDYTSNGNNGTCYYILDNTTQDLPACSDSRFSVDYDGQYNLQLFAFNSTDSVNQNVTFTVDRTSEFQDSKPLLAGFIIIVLLLGAFLFNEIGKFFETKNIIAQDEPSLMKFLKTLSVFSSLLFVFVALMLMLAISKEYIKFPYFENVLGTTAYIYITIIIIALVIFFVGILVWVISYVQDKRAGRL